MRSNALKSKELPDIRLASNEVALRKVFGSEHHVQWHGRTEELLRVLPDAPIFDFVVTSPPYNLGKEYEERTSLDQYVCWQEEVIRATVSRMKPNSSLCWQVGNYVDNGEIVPLDIALHPVFAKLGLKLRNRIVWKFGHGLHSKRRLSGRYEVVLWYTNGDDYRFNLDAIRVPSKYPGKRHYKGPKIGQFSSNPLGKNPEDIWDIPNVKSNHVEKTSHPCQFPVGLIERLLLALTSRGDLVFDPFSGVATTGVACVLHKRRYLGSELSETYVGTGVERMRAALKGDAKFRSHAKPIYDHTSSRLSRRE